MVSKEKFQKIVNEVLVEMYDKAETYRNFNPIKEDDLDLDEDWYKQFYLSKEDQEKIIEEYIQEYDLSSFERKSLRMKVFDIGPTNSEKAYEESK